MNPPTWVDEQGRPLAKRSCPSCGREIPVLSVPIEQLRFYGWRPWQVEGKAS
jgi:hypothetical protein